MSNNVVLQELVPVGVRYVYNSDSLNRVLTHVSPTGGGGVTVEYNYGRRERVQGVQAGTADATVLWQTWTPGTVTAAAVDNVLIPWSAMRITVTTGPCNVTIATGTDNH